MKHLFMLILAVGLLPAGASPTWFSLGGKDDNSWPNIVIITSDSSCTELAISISGFWVTDYVRNQDTFKIRFFSQKVG